MTYSTQSDAIKDVNFSPLAYADKELATTVISSLDILCDHHAADGSSRGNEEGDERGLEPVMSFADTHIAYETLFQADNIVGDDEQKILNTEFVPFHLKLRVSK